MGHDFTSGERYQTDHSASPVIAAKDKRIAELEAALTNLVDHHIAMSGPRAHHLGCGCGGTNDGKHSCASFQSAVTVAAALLR